MQIDFHFCMIYVLSRAVGFNTETSEKIAWASQFVDDCREDIKIRDESGELIPKNKRIVTSYNPINPKNFVFEEGFNVWIPFHFLPAGKGDSLPERLICRNAMENPYVEKIIENYRSHSFDPIYLGIILHVIADTFSHQGFNGMLSDENNIDEVQPQSLLSEKSRKNDLINFLKDEFKRFVLETFRVGHAEAEFLPDIPYLKWSYVDSKGLKKIICNIERVRDAIEFIYNILLNEAQRQSINIELDKIKIISNLVEKAKNFCIYDKIERYKKWINAIKNGDFGIEEEVEYRADNVQNDWLLKFHRNATDHKKFVQKEILKDIFAEGYI